MGSGGVASLINPSGVGPTDLQTMANQWLANQQKLQGAYEFGQSGLGHSTGATQREVAGPEAQFATAQGLNAIANTGAENAFLNQQFSGLASGLGKIIPGIAGLFPTG